MAIKVIDMEEVEDDLEELMKEIDILARSRCENITEYHVSFNRPGTSELWIVMQVRMNSLPTQTPFWKTNQPSFPHSLISTLFLSHSLWLVPLQT